MEEVREVDKEKEYKRIESWLKKLLLDNWDKFDLKAEYDPKLSHDEQKSVIRGKIKHLMKDKDNIKDQAAQVKAEQEKLEYEAKMKAEAEVQEYNRKIVYDVNQEVDKYYQPIHRAVDKMCKGYGHLTFIKGRAGTGKSWNIRRILLENSAEFVEVSGEVTEAYLYRLLYENNGKIMWFKDVANLLSGLKSIQILKAATETEDARVITKSNYSKQQADLPDRFVCKCKFIFDYNNVKNSMRDDFEALISRGDFLEFTLSPKEMEYIMRQIVKTDEEREITEFVIGNFKGSGLVRMNLRTQWKAINTYNYAKALSLDWKEEIKMELGRVSKVRALLYGLIGNEVIRRGELKKLLLKHEIVNNIRTASNRVQEWVFIDELFQWGPDDEYNGFVSLVPRGELGV